MAANKPKKTAAGLPGVTHGLSKAITQMGGTRTALTLLAVNQVQGFDCPGCAWPEPRSAKRSHFEFCENGAKAVAEEATRKRITPTFFAEHPVTELTRQTDHWLGQQGRLTSPMVKHPGSDHYVPLSWNEAFQLTARHLREIAPDEALFYTSGRTSNEAAFLYQMFARSYGTNNLPDCSNMCHESSGVALSSTIGVGKGTVTLDDLHHARLIVVAGQNPGTNHPRMLGALEIAKRNGARIISVNPLPEAGLSRFKNPQKLSGLLGRGIKLSDLHLPIKVGGDLALFQAIGAHLVAWNAIDRSFVDTHTTDFAAYAGSASLAPLVAYIRATSPTILPGPATPASTAPPDTNPFADTAPAGITPFADTAPADTGGVGAGSRGQVGAAGAISGRGFEAGVGDAGASAGGVGAGVGDAGAGASDVERGAQVAAWIAGATGLAWESIAAAAKMFAESDATIVCWAMGLTQGRDAVATIQEIVNVQLLRGMVGKPGAGLCPVRGHSNVQGDRTMGIFHEVPSWASRMPISVPPNRGYDTVESIRAMRDGKAKVFVGLGGNFAAATPDTEVTEAAMRQLSLAVHISTKLNRSHVIVSREQTALILPCLGRTETDPAGFVTVEDSMSNVHASRGKLEPASPELRSETAIICGLAKETLGVDWQSYQDDYRSVRALIADVVPGFEDFEARVAGEGFTLAQGPRDSRSFPTPSGRAVFTVSPLTTVSVPQGRLLLQTLRSHDQYNTTIYGLDDRYRGIKGERRVILVHPDDLRKHGIEDGEIIDIVSEWPDRERRANGFRAVAYPTVAGCAAAYFPEANVLVPLDSTAHGSNTPVSKQIVIRLVKK